MEFLNTLYDLVLVGSIAYLSINFVRFVNQRSQCKKIVEICEAAIEVQKNEWDQALGFVEPIEIEVAELEAIVPVCEVELSVPVASAAKTLAAEAVLVVEDDDEDIDRMTPKQLRGKYPRS